MGFSLLSPNLVGHLWKIIEYLDVSTISSFGLVCKLLFYYSAVASINDIKRRFLTDTTKPNRVRVCGIVQSRQKRGRHLTFLHLEAVNELNVQIVLMRDKFCAGFGDKASADQVYDAYVNLCVPGSVIWCEGAWDNDRSRSGWLSMYGSQIVLVRSHYEPASIMRLLEFVRSGVVSESQVCFTVANNNFF